MNEKQKSLDELISRECRKNKGNCEDCYFKEVCNESENKEDEKEIR